MPPLNPKGRITLHPHACQVTVSVGDTVVADTTSAVELREKGYPPRQYLPREDIDMGVLVPSETSTHCPFKGDTHYYSLALAHETIADVAWSYEEPYAAMSVIAGLVSFDEQKVKQTVQD